MIIWVIQSIPSKLLLLLDGATFNWKWHHVTESGTKYVVTESGTKQGEVWSQKPQAVTDSNSHNIAQY